MGFLYLYGMVMSSDSIRLCGKYPEADGYGEIYARNYAIGGETGTAAAILAAMGCAVRLAGSHTGHRNDSVIRGYFTDKGVDLSELVYDAAFTGVEDMILIAEATRTVFGEFGKHFSGGLSWVEAPCEASVADCDAVGCDPFFGDEIARLCVKHSKPYAVIDCRHDSYFNRNCAVNAISHEFILSNYIGLSYADALGLYTAETDGLVIITLGENGMLYGRRGQVQKTMPAFPVKVESTLGAGDSFKAGTIFALANGFDDDRLVEFAAATAAYSCAHYPISKNPATLAGVVQIIAGK
ncbi:MAG: PfkB family carbohydrate kinase [Oscillospiraceae bacterium]